MFLTMIKGVPGIVNIRNALKDMRRIMPSVTEINPEALLQAILNGIGDIPVPEFQCVKVIVPFANLCSGLSPDLHA